MTWQRKLRLIALLVGLLSLPLPGRCQETAAAPTVVLPVAGYVDGRTLKTYGLYAKDRFTGYHVGDDVEVADKSQEVPVVAMAAGRVRYAGWANGYGGVIVLEHKIAGQTIQSLYGHLRLASTTLKIGDRVTVGQFLADLGADKSRETDGERKHLHFSLRVGRTLNLRGYVGNMKDVSGWLNPQDFFAAQGIDLNIAPRDYDPTRDRGGAEFPLSFAIPSGWNVEYVPQIHALNVFTLSGSGAARGRSQILIMNVSAKPSTALKGFKIGSSETVQVGTGLAAVKSEVTKKWSTSVYLQPAWRAQRHAVWVLGGPDAGHSFVIAANPKAPSAEQGSVLSSLVFRF